jgi:tRNA A58 N-methylase Trm61
MTYEEILEKIADIPSNVKDEDSAMHIKYLQGLSGIPLILDFGTGWAKLIISIALACPQAEIYTFDPGAPYQDYEPAIRKILNDHLSRDLHFEINNSFNYQWERELDVLSIDSDHSYETTKYEIERFWPFVKSGGLILMHDYIIDTVEVKKAVDEYMITHPFYEILESAGYTTVIKKL